MGLFSSIGNAIGKTLNAITGVSSSAQQAQNYTMQNMAASQGMTLEQMAKSNEYINQQMQQSHNYTMQQMAQNFNYEKQAAQNAIQWQMQDLKKAGLNPILAAGYGGANLGGAVGATGASGGGVSGGAGATSGATGTSGMSPMDLINGLTSAKKTLADAKAAENQAILTGKQAGIYNKKTMQEISESKSRIATNSAKAGLAQANAAKAYTDTEATKGSNDYLKRQAIKNGKTGAKKANNPIMEELFKFLGG